MKSIKKIVAVCMVLFAVSYNLWLYRLEPTAKIDPNDNPFQYALVHRTNEMWDFAAKQCPKNPLFPLCFVGYLVDHNVPNWAQGYSLPFYYSHAPQITIVATYRLFKTIRLLPVINSITETTVTDSMTDTYQTTLFAYYHVVIYILLCLFPISVFLALRVIKLPWLISGIGALIASHISTDGLYGLDPSSFLWRGFGLSSQLFAMMFMPLAIAYALRFLQEYNPSLHLTFHSFKSTLLSFSCRHNFLPAVLFLTLSIMGHLGLGLMTIMSVGIVAISPTFLALLEKKPLKEIRDTFISNIFKLLLLTGPTILILSYWIVPVLLQDNYHNISFWDPVWKFNSWGWKEVVIQLINGHHFDFGRIPVLTVLVLIGGFSTFSLSHLSKQFSNNKDNILLYPLSFLFLFWFVLFFGRTTWGGLIDLFPGMKEFHQSRFIVGIHLSGFFLIPIGCWWLSSIITQAIHKSISLLQKSAELFEDQATQDSKLIQKISINSTVLFSMSILLVAVLVSVLAYPQTYRYANFNDILINRGNDNFIKQNEDVELLFSTIRELKPGRVFTGRGGTWGKDLEIAETTYFMHLSTYGLPVILWLPETWSPNSDVEQFFIEDWAEHYDLMNVRYVVTTKDIEAKPFWEKINETNSWTLYSVPTSGYFTTGSHAAVVYSEKQHFINVIRLWLQSDNVKNKIFPQLTFKYAESATHTLPNFQMVDESTYSIRGGEHISLFDKTPTYESPASRVQLVGPESVNADMMYKTVISAPEDCNQCLAILKVTDHPNWHTYINGKKVNKITVFPFYIGVPVSNLKDAVLEVRYEPSKQKLFLMVLGMSALTFICIKRYVSKKSS